MFPMPLYCIKYRVDFTCVPSARVAAVKNVAKMQNNCWQFVKFDLSYIKWLFNDKETSDVLLTVGGKPWAGFSPVSHFYAGHCGEEEKIV